MMFPSVFGENLFDDWMDDFGFRDNFFSGKNPLYGKHAKNIMKTDVRETDKGYELDVDLPGFKKDEVQVQLKDGYLTISAAKTRKAIISAVNVMPAAQAEASMLVMV